MLNKLIDNLPLDLRIAVAATLQEPSLNCGCAEAREVVAAKYARNRIDQGTVAKWQGAIDEWIKNQRIAQSDAEDIMRELWERFAPKNTDIPVWFGKKWSFDLRNPWSASLGDSVQEARAWMAEQ